MDNWKGRLEEQFVDEDGLMRMKYRQEELEDFIQQEIDRARKGQFTQGELKRIGDLLGFMLSDYPSSYWKEEDKQIEIKLSKLLK